MTSKPEKSSPTGARPPERSHRLYHILSTRPVVIVTWESLDTIDQMCELIEEDEAYFIAVFKWTMESEDKVERLAQDYARHQEKHRGYHLLYLCNTPAEYELLSRHNVPGVLCHQNAFLDERIYRICPDMEKRFDAVYNAQIAPYKRHCLAQRVKSLALITYTLYYQPIEQRKAYFDELKKVLPWAVMLNWEGHPEYGRCLFDPHLPRIPNEKISEHLCMAGVGLMLSKEEGGCFAVTEYLLSGLPVVSTKSKGGRDVWFDEEYAAIVEDTPEAVAEGVRDMINRNIPAEYIRDKTLEKMKVHRNSFIALVNQLYRRAGVDRDFRDDWKKVYRNRMMRAEPWPGSFAAEVNRVS